MAAPSLKVIVVTNAALQLTKQATPEAMPRMGAGNSSAIIILRP